MRSDNPRRQTLGTVQAKPPMPSSSKTSGGASVSSGNVPPRRRIPKSRKSMVPNIGSSSNSSVNRENNGRVSGIAAPSPSRRTSTAGQQRPSSANSRKSLGGAILQSGHHGATPAKNRRVSIAPNGNSSSNNGNSSQSHPNVDPRDVKDKSFLLGAIKKMVSYLKSRGYDATALNIKQLVNGPSGRDFNHIMTFLFRRVDPTFNTPIPPGQKNNGDLIIKFEDEVSMAFKCLGYPFPISKTGLVAVGSPHTWPALIAAIDWLVDVLVVAEGEATLDWEMEENPQEEELLLQTFQGMSQRSERQWHQFLRKSMISFLNNDQEECDELEGDLLEAFHRDNEKVEAYLNRMIEENEGTKLEIERLNAEVNNVNNAHEKQEEYATDIEKFLNLIQTLEDHKAELTNKVETLTMEKTTMEAEMEDCAKTIQRLKDTIGSQELSQEDVRRMQREKDRLDVQIEKQNDILNGHLNMLKEAEEKWSACFQLLERTVQEYNSKATDLELIPETAKHAKGKKLEVILDEESAAEGTIQLMGGVDVAGAAKSHVEKFVKTYDREILTEKRRMIEVKENVEAVESSGADLAENIDFIKERIVCSQEECNAEQQKLENEVKAKKDELERLNTKISSLNDPQSIETAIEKYNAQYRQLQTRQQKEEKDHAVRLKAVSEEIRSAVELAEEWQEHKRKALNKHNAQLEAAVEFASQLKLLDS
mmetsp:Transcript_19429/g.33117  ORF Transcript_19429/g.33117 Transcript_19429/m.33117 type:complete len:706 (-) Transcript_19429:92-2209(-)